MKPRIIVGVALSLVFAFTLTGAHEDNIASLTVIETGGKLSVNGSMLDTVSKIISPKLNAGRWSRCR